VKQELSQLNDSIVVKRKENERLVIKYQNIQGEKNGSFEMVNDSKTMYRKQYMENWNLVLGICIVILTMYFVFRKAPPPPSYTKS
jgi:intein-encoded DNA endonuclease-like protein